MRSEYFEALEKAISFEGIDEVVAWKLTLLKAQFNNELKYDSYRSDPNFNKITYSEALEKAISLECMDAEDVNLLTRLKAKIEGKLQEEL